MNVEKLVQNLRSSDKQLISDTMQCLIQMIEESSKIQEEIIKFLPTKDINKLMKFLEDNDPDLRKLTVIFFLNLLYDNYIVQQVFCDILGIVPMDGKVCLNRIPETFKSVSKELPDFLENLKQTYPQELEGDLPFSWHYNLQILDSGDQKVNFIRKEDIELQNCEFEYFPDPLYDMIGFCMRNPKRLFEMKTRVLINMEKKEEKNKMKNQTKYANQNKAKVSARLENSTNSSLDHSLTNKLFGDSTRNPHTGRFFGLSPFRSNPKSPLYSGRHANKSNGREGVAKQKVVKNKRNQAICKTERAATAEFDSNTENTDLPIKSIESNNKIPNRIGSISAISEIGKRAMTIIAPRDTETSIDNLDYFQSSKLNGFLDDSLEANNRYAPGVFLPANKSVEPKFRDEAVLNLSEESNRNKPGKGFENNGGNNYIAAGYGKSFINEPKRTKTVGNNAVSNLDIKEKKNQYKTKESLQYPLNLTTPKNNLLSKLLKDQPFVQKDTNYIAKFKGGHENGSNHPSSSNQGTTKMKSPIGNSSKNKTNNVCITQPNVVYNKEKIDNEYLSKKQAFHSSLLKSIDTIDKITYQTSPDELFESSCDNKYGSISAKGSHLGTNNFKSIGGTLKPTKESSKSVVSVNKHLTARKSQDLTYLTKHKSKGSNDLFNNSLSSFASTNIYKTMKLPESKELTIKTNQVDNVNFYKSNSPRSAVLRDPQYKLKLV